jgi:TPP-dependent pyruvate/acetoin dehydrogenase alpha subunit
VLFRARLLDDLGFVSAELEAMEKTAQDVIDDAIAFAERSPSPLPHTAFTDVFA